MTPKGTKNGHFLTPDEQQTLKMGPLPKTKRTYLGPAAVLDRETRLRKFNRVSRKAKEKAKAALEDLAFLSRSMDQAWVRDAMLHRLRSGVTYLEMFLNEAVGKVGWERLEVDDLGRGEFFAQRLAAAIQGGLMSESRMDANPRVEIVLPPSSSSSMTVFPPFGTRYDVDGSPRRRDKSRQVAKNRANP